MRKHVIDTNRESQTSGIAWLKLDELATVEVTSEDPAHPIEAALVPSRTGEGWRAAQPGEQRIRLVFDQPQRIKRIRLNFAETQFERTQEFVLRWSPGGPHFQEIVRQQWNFSPGGATRQVEDYAVDLSEVSVLELILVPDKNRGPGVASIEEFRLA